MLLLVPAVVNGLALASGWYVFYGIIAIPPLVLSLFWWITARLGWEPLIATPLRWRRLAIQVVVGLPILYCVAIFALTAWHANLYSGNCSKALNLKTGPEEFTFTAKVAFSGFYEASDRKWKGPWAIATVEEQFLRSDRRLPRFVMLVNNVFHKDGIYLVQGQRRNYVLPRPLTVVDAEPCTCTFPADRARTELHILRKLGVPATTGGHRIVGEIRTASDGPLAGIRVRVQASPANGQQPLLFVTNSEGIYATSELTTGDYTVEPLDLPAGHRSLQWTVPERLLTSRGIMVLDFRLDR